MALEVELAFEGVVDRFDDLAERFEKAGAGPGSFVAEPRAQQPGAVAGLRTFEALRLAPLLTVGEELGDRSEHRREERNDDRPIHLPPPSLGDEPADCSIWKRLLSE